jgi:hypothetical protein
MPIKEGQGIKRSADAYLPKSTSKTGKTPKIKAIGKAIKIAYKYELKFNLTVYHKLANRSFSVTRMPSEPITLKGSGRILVGTISYLAIRCHRKIIIVTPTTVIIVFPNLPKLLSPPNLKSRFSIIVLF